jgi:hypothetical protein
MERTLSWLQGNVENTAELLYQLGRTMGAVGCRPYGWDANIQRDET